MPKITILTENHVRRRGLLAEHGLSLWIEDGEEKILFDVGQTDVYVRNARAMQIDLTAAHAIVLSHGHYDHGGGLASFPEEARWPRVFVHPDALKPKYEIADDARQAEKAIGFPCEVSKLSGLEKRLMFNPSTLQIGGRLFLITGIPPNTDCEKPAANLAIRQGDKMVIDDLHDEQILVCQLEQGLAVLLGCSHPGVINCLEYVRQLFPGQPIRSVIGGMHLEKADYDRIRQTIDCFRRLNIDQIVPLHCTGQNSVWRMRSEMGSRVLISCTGDTLQID